MRIIKKLWMFVVFIALSLAAAFSAAGFLQAGFLSLPSTPPLLSDGDNLETHTGLLNGYKGYRHHRTGFRRHGDGWWYPKEAFDVTVKEKLVRSQLTEDVVKSAPITDKEPEKVVPEKVDIVRPPMQHVARVQKPEAVTKPTPATKSASVKEVVPTKKTALVRKEAKQAKRKEIKPKKGQLSAKHIKWCRKKYRSYHVANNTFQPMKGKRKVCLSPY